MSSLWIQYIKCNCYLFRNKTLILDGLLFKKNNYFSKTIYPLFMIPTDTYMPNQANEHIHQGRNVKRIREMLGIKQEALAIELGDDWNQQKISILEGKDIIDPNLLKQVASALKVNPEAIKNFNEEAAVSYINTFNDHSSGFNYNCTFNPIDKIVELYDELLKSERDKIQMLQEQLKNR